MSGYFWPGWLLLRLRNGGNKLLTFYVSKTGNVLNRKPWRPEKLTPYLCLCPTRPVKLEGEVKILTDSGAFQDVDKNTRLTPIEALKRQLTLERQCNYISHRIVSYDRLVDEQLNENGKKIKRRVDEATGLKFVEETIEAAHFLHVLRKELQPRQLVLSCQGVTVEQYIYCLTRILEFAKPQDCIGMGGFCIVGRFKKQLAPQFYEIQEKAFPLIQKAGIKDIHLFGVTALPILENWLKIAQGYNFNLSIDSSSFERRSINGEVFCFGKWKQLYTRPDKYIKYHPCDLGIANIERGIHYFENMN